MMVSDLVDANGCWRLDILSTWLPSNIINKLHAIMPPRMDNHDDQRAWSGTPTGTFSIASAYMMLCRFNDDERHADWQLIWKIKIPERVRCFVWLIRHDRLITNY
jgi:hypothetical protein